ncbi:hypothetical protein C1645_769011 [Glomus cerebriforme]|uniref:Uncharacterized protein n=1 Tax=Glomus cerebriforme TaxID=658196 RepID=A0A397SXN2_9GLOM|nr:hypothetical protein C1645_769011 [Glomus cerebriforme]
MCNNFELNWNMICSLLLPLVFIVLFSTSKQLASSVHPYTNDAQLLFLLNYLS